MIGTFPVRECKNNLLTFPALFVYFSSSSCKDLLRDINISMGGMIGKSG